MARALSACCASMEPRLRSRRPRRRRPLDLLLDDHLVCQKAMASLPALVLREVRLEMAPPKVPLVVERLRW